ncbi:MAG: PQQ-binding-like beta-propeller repeat protein, partial [Planctomycetes bacterium]|nr:PQQ-binding-like beta-propeller repeat protein [Planctomycetota bacterium]
MRLAVVLLAAAPIVAQAAAPRWLANGDVLDAATGQSVARLEGKGHGQAAWLAVDQYASGSLVVDLAAGEVLAPMGDALVLSDLAGRERWRAEVAVGAPGEGWPPPRFVGDRVVAILAGGALVGLDRRDGHVVWRRATDGMRLDVDGGLAFVSNLRASELGFELTALAAENGAEAFRVALPGPVDRLAAASHGIAVAAAGQLVVVDRTGPELFRITTPVVDVAAGTRDWFVLTGKELAAFDRSGERRFGIPAAASGIDRCRFVRSASGALLLLHYCRMSDSG